jgi:hypothetical protein
MTFIVYVEIVWRIESNDSLGEVFVYFASRRAPFAVFLDTVHRPVFEIKESAHTIWETTSASGMTSGYRELDSSLADPTKQAEHRVVLYHMTLLNLVFLLYFERWMMDEIQKWAIQMRCTTTEIETNKT